VVRAGYGVVLARGLPRRGPPRRVAGLTTPSP
jgi:hypothetical protein